jgi:hypothetical protein
MSDSEAHTLTTEESVKTPFKHEELKGVALDWVMDKYKDENLCSIIWEKEDEEGFNYFKVLYHKKSKKD